jgi:hypothetical protein
MSPAKRNPAAPAASHVNSTQDTNSLSTTATVSLLKSVAHNIGVVLVGFLVAYVGTRLDALLGWQTAAHAAGWAAER